MSVGLADAPLELLQVHLAFHLAHHCHVRLGDRQVGSPPEAELLVDVHDLVVVGHLREEDRLAPLVDRPHPVVQTHQILILREQFAG
jgi:hypothetical protein